MIVDMSRFEDWGRDCALHTASRLRRELGALAIAMPPATANAYAILDRVAGSQPIAPDHNAVRDRILDGSDQDAIDSALLAELSATRLLAAWAAARTVAAQRIATAVHCDYEELYEALRERAEQHIEVIKRAAAVDVPLDALIRAGRSEDAAAVAQAATAVASLDVLHSLHSTIEPVQMVVDSVDCRFWRDQRQAKHVASVGDSRCDYIIAAIRGGAELWFPSADEARGAARAIAEEYRKQWTRDEAIRKRQVTGVGPVMLD